MHTDEEQTHRVASRASTPSCPKGIKLCSFYNYVYNYYVSKPLFISRCFHVTNSLRKAFLRCILIHFVSCLTWIRKVTPWIPRWNWVIGCWDTDHSSSFAEGSEGKPCRAAEIFKSEKAQSHLKNLWSDLFSAQQSIAELISIFWGARRSYLQTEFSCGKNMAVLFQACGSCSMDATVT